MGYSGPRSLGWHKALFESDSGPKFTRYDISRSKVGGEASNRGPKYAR